MFPALLICVSITAAPEPTRAEIRFFEKRVRPLLVKHCFKCHGEQKQWSGLRLDSRAAILRGGDSGAAAVSGKPRQSLLIQAVRHKDPDQRMPKGGKLSAQEIATLERWVKLGMPFPTSQKPTGRKLRDPNHWAFRPLTAVALPPVGPRQQAGNGIDRFILARLNQRAIVPSELADKRTLIRRVTYDLIGLPPTPGQIQVFLNDSSPAAYERLVDRLLASPRYGERWGRHWLDVARYADSNGLDENVAHGNAWRYRDYVVASLNRDKPIDRFITEQLAGDLLPFANEAQRREQLIATGFLSIGPKVLAETDLDKMKMDIVDEQLDTTGRAFLGLTFGCARCHDHKFDPISTAEYYALAGIFKSTLTMRKYIKVAEWHEYVLPSAEMRAKKKAYEAKLKRLKENIANLTKTGGQTAELKKLKQQLAKLQKAGAELPSAMGVKENKVVDVRIHLRGDPLKLGAVARRTTPAVLRGPNVPRFSTKQSGRLQLARWLTDQRHPLTARVFVNRVWRWHFGVGLVRSTDNFGLLGERPSHPKLLDWLAKRFITSGFSVKALNRWIVTSRVYRQGSDATPSAKQRDPENRLFSRARVRRLEAEAVRDALLAVSGQLDLKMGGSLLKLKNRAYFFDHTSIDKTKYDTFRRSLYLPVVRNHVYDVFQLLDFPDPAVTTGSRSSTVVSSQALLMMNSDLVMQAATRLAQRLPAANVRERLDRLYLVAFGRRPNSEERQADQKFLSDAQAASLRKERVTSEQAWTLLCHVLLAANEFIYVK